MAHHIHCHIHLGGSGSTGDKPTFGAERKTDDAGTSEGARKAAATRKAHGGYVRGKEFSGQSEALPRGHYGMGGNFSNFEKEYHSTEAQKQSHNHLTSAGFKHQRQDGNDIHHYEHGTGRATAAIAPSGKYAIGISHRTHTGTGPEELKSHLSSMKLNHT